MTPYFEDRNLNVAFSSTYVSYAEPLLQRPVIFIFPCTVFTHRDYISQRFEVCIAMCGLGWLSSVPFNEGT